LLSPSGELAETYNSIASVLVTRVQLSIASYDFVTKAATSKGYASLVYFHDENNPNSFGAASNAFPPDPVCTALSVGLMQESWFLSKANKDGNGTVKGHYPIVWV